MLSIKQQNLSIKYQGNWERVCYELKHVFIKNQMQVSSTHR